MNWIKQLKIEKKQSRRGLGSNFGHHTIKGRTHQVRPYVGADLCVCPFQTICYADLSLYPNIEKVPGWHFPSL